jgi:hypothetical protein
MGGATLICFSAIHKFRNGCFALGKAKAVDYSRSSLPKINWK